MDAKKNDSNSEIFHDINHANQMRKFVGKVFRGGVVDIGGLYMVSHGSNAMGARCGMDHEVLLAKGGNFSTCRHCGGGVSSWLARAAISG